MEVSKMRDVLSANFAALPEWQRYNLARWYAIYVYASDGYRSEVSRMGVLFASAPSSCRCEYLSVVNEALNGCLKVIGLNPVTYGVDSNPHGLASVMGVIDGLVENLDVEPG